MGKIMRAELFRGTPQAWNEKIAELPGAHVLQTWEWAQVKSLFGWRPFPFLWQADDGQLAAAAMLLARSAPVPGLASRLKIVYIPKGPLLDWQDPSLRAQVLQEIADQARRLQAIFVKIDPDVPLGCGIPGRDGSEDNPLGLEVEKHLIQLGWHFSEEQIQFRNTVILDLRPDLETLLSNMKQKTRYNIRLAARKGVSIRIAGLADIDLLHRMYAETANRDGFVIREPVYYQTLWRAFFEAGLAEALIAEVAGEPVAALVLFRFAGRAWYMSGMSSLKHREKMPNYLLQWEAIQRARAAGVKDYDLWGAPDDFIEGDPLWRVFRFKEGLGGQVVRNLGAWDFPLRPGIYRIYSQLLPRLLNIMRRRGVERTRRMVG